MVSELVKKMQLKEEFSVLLLNANPGIHPHFDGVRFEYKGFDNQKYDSLVMFAKDEQEIGQYLPKADEHSKPNCLFLEIHSDADVFFGEFASTNKRDFLGWIHQIKKPQ